MAQDIPAQNNDDVKLGRKIRKGAGAVYGLAATALGAAGLVTGAFFDPLGAVVVASTLYSGSRALYRSGFPGRKVKDVIKGMLGERPKTPAGQGLSPAVSMALRLVANTVTVVAGFVTAGVSLIAAIYVPPVWALAGMAIGAGMCVEATADVFRMFRGESSKASPVTPAPAVTVAGQDSALSKKKGLEEDFTPVAENAAKTAGPEVSKPSPATPPAPQR